jgi:hypothetical protein
MALFIDGRVGLIFDSIMHSTVALTLSCIGCIIITIMRLRVVSITLWGRASGVTSRVKLTLTTILHLHQSIRNRSQYQQSPTIATCSKYPHLRHDTENIRNIGQTMQGPPSLHNTSRELRYLLGYIIQKGSIAQIHDSLQNFKVTTVCILVHHPKDFDKAVT